MKLLTLLFCLISCSSIACICILPESDAEIDEKFNHADVVFIGTVESVTERDRVDNQSAGSEMIVFRLETIYKGDTKNTVVKVSQRISTCSEQFRIGQKYLIFGRSNGKEFVTSGCSAFIFHPDIDLIKRMVRRLTPKNLAASDAEFGLNEFVLTFLLIPIVVLAILTNILLSYLGPNTRQMFKGNASVGSLGFFYKRKER